MIAWPKGLNPQGLWKAPALAGTRRADVNRRIIPKIARTAEDVCCLQTPVWFRLRRFRVGKGGLEASIDAKGWVRLCPRGPASQSFRVGKIAGGAGLHHSAVQAILPTLRLRFTKRRSRFHAHDATPENPHDPRRGGPHAAAGGRRN